MTFLWFELDALQTGGIADEPGKVDDVLDVSVGTLTSEVDPIHSSSDVVDVVREPDMLERRHLQELERVVQGPADRLRVRRPKERCHNPKGEFTIGLVHSVDDLEDELVDVDFNGGISSTRGGLGDVGDHHVQAGEDDDALVDGRELLEHGLARLTRLDFKILDLLPLVGPNVVDEVRVSDQQNFRHLDTVQRCSNFKNDLYCSSGFRRALHERVASFVSHAANQF